MTTVATSSAFKTLLGVGKETVKGTPVAPVLWLPVTTYQPKDSFAALLDTASRGGNVDVYNVVQGVGMSEYDLGGAIFPDTFGVPLAGILGDVVVTGASAPFSHAMANTQANGGQPGAWTFAHIDPLNANPNQQAGMQFAEVNMVLDRDQLATWTAKGIGYPSAVAASPASPAFSGIVPLEGWRFAATIGGVAVPELLHAEISIKRAGTVAEHTLQGIQAPAFVFADEVSVDGKLTFVAAVAGTQLNYYLTNAVLPVVLTAVRGAGAAQDGLTLTMSKVNYTAAGKGFGSKYITVEADLKASGNTTDVGASGGYSPIKATLLNAKPAGTFA